jgi:acetate---CoA ligase (ADP-forming) subunit beta
MRPAATRDRTSSTIGRALEEGRLSLLEYEADKVAKAQGIKVAPSGVARSAREAGVLARTLGPPVVMKIVSRDILHKSDVGGVVTGIGTPGEARAAYAEMLRNVKRAKPNAKVEGVLVQRMAPKGTEFVVGGVRDPQFGPAVMFGLGGIYVELFRDVAFRLAPLTETEALAMMRETKSSKLLAGFRGSKPLDSAAAAKTIVAVGNLISEHPEVDSVDINPLFVYPKGVLAVDVRVILKGTGNH